MEDPLDPALTEILKLDLGVTDRWIGELIGFAPVPAPFLPDWLAVRHLVRGADNPTLSREAKARIFELLAACSERSTKLFLAAHPETPPSMLARLAGDADEEVSAEARERADHQPIDRQIAAARDPSASKATLRALAASEHDIVRLSVAESSVLPPDTAIALANDANASVRRAVASNAAAPRDALEVLADEHPLEVARHAASGPATLERLAKHPDPSIRQTVAWHAQTPPAALAKLSLDPASVRAVARHPSASPELLLSLIQHADPHVRASASEHPQLPESARVAALQGRALAGDRVALERLARMEELPATLLRRMAESPLASVRAVAAGHRSSPIELLSESVLREQDVEVLAHAASNPSAPPHLLEGLAGEGLIRAQLHVLEKAIAEDARKKKPALTDEEIGRMLRQGEAGWLSVARQMVVRVQLMVAFNPATRAELRDELLRNLGPFDRCLTQVFDIPSGALREHALRSLFTWATRPQLELLAAQPKLAPWCLAILEERGIVTPAPPPPKERAAPAPRPAPEEKRRAAASIPAPPTPPPEVSAETLIEWASSADELPRLRAASNPATPDPILDRLARDPLQCVRLGLQRHPRGRRSALAAYAESRIAFVRLVAVLHPEVPEASIENAASSASWVDCWAAARNVRSPERVLERLAQHPHPLVREASLRSRDLIEAFWQRFLRTQSDPVQTQANFYESFRFSSTKEAANALGELVLQGVKTATSSLLWEIEAEGRPVVRPKHLSIVTDWDGNPLCVVETIEVRILPFSAIDEELAYDYGEGDRTLAWWRPALWESYRENCEALGRERSEDMPLVCERFRVVFRE